MNRFWVTAVALALLGLACLRFHQPPQQVSLFDRPLSASAAVKGLDALRKAGIPCQLDRQAQKLLIAPDRLGEARQKLKDLELNPPDTAADAQTCPPELLKAVTNVAGIQAANLRLAGKEVYVMLDLDGRPRARLAQDVVEAILRLRPELRAADIKLVDSQCRDLNAAKTSPLPPFLQYRQALQLNAIYTRELRQALLEKLPYDVVRAELIYKPINTEGPDPRTTRVQTLQVKLYLAPSAQEKDKNLALSCVDKLKKELGMARVPEEQFSLEILEWTADSRPLSRALLEQLKAGLASPPPAPESPWVGLLLLTPGLALWAWFSLRLLERHRLTRDSSVE